LDLRAAISDRQEVGLRAPPWVVWEAAFRVAREDPEDRVEVSADAVGRVAAASAEGVASEDRAVQEDEAALDREVREDGAALAVRADSGRRVLEIAATPARTKSGELSSLPFATQRWMPGLTP
jgi:hypothetical protein